MIGYNLYCNVLKVTDKNKDRYEEAVDLTKKIIDKDLEFNKKGDKTRDDYQDFLANIIFFFNIVLDGSYPMTHLYEYPDVKLMFKFKEKNYVISDRDLKEGLANCRLYCAQVCGDIRQNVKRTDELDCYDFVIAGVLNAFSTKFLKIRLFKNTENYHGWAIKDLKNGYNYFMGRDYD